MIIFIALFMMIMHNKLFLSVTLMFSALATTAQASTTSLNLGVAGQFDAFVLGDMNAHNSDVEGRLAVGGNLALKDYAIGMQLSDSNGNRDDLIVGGSLMLRNTRVYNGNARSGGAANIDNTVGFYSDDPTKPNGRYVSGNPLDFSLIGQELKNQSSYWKSLNHNGQENFIYGGLNLTGKESNVNIFSVTAEDLSHINKLSLDVPLNSWTLINVSGDTASMSNFGAFWMNKGAEKEFCDDSLHCANDFFGVDKFSLAQRVLFNFFDAKTLDLHAIGVRGSILAPLAAATFYDGRIDGNLVVGSLNGKDDKPSGQINHHPLTPSPVPVPPAVILFASGFMTLLLMRGRAFFRTA